MKKKTACHRHRAYALITILVMTLVSWPQPAEAAADATITMRPPCDVGEYDNDSPFGPIPSPDPIVTPGPGKCYDYEIVDPQTMRTSILQEGDIVDVEIAIDNPSKQKIKRIRAWLSYDPDILEGESIEISDDFPEVTPGESNFSESQGYAMMEASAEDDNLPNDSTVVFAHVQFRVISTPNGGTIVSFHDAKSGGHTDVTVAGDAEEEESILESEPGVLLVRFSANGSPGFEDGDDGSDSESDLLPDGSACTENTECESNLCVNEVCMENKNVPNGGECSANSQCESKLCTGGVCTGNPNGSTCFTNGQCASNLCAGGICTERQTNQPVGSSCTSNAQCASGLCVDNICREKVDALPDGSVCSDNSECASGQCTDNVCVASASTSSVDSGDDAERTAFSLLQVRNLRASTEGSSAFLAWDPLQSSQLKAYNVYYGTTTGRYIQRKTVEAGEPSLTIRSLPVGTTYYFAVRAVSLTDEESAFSQEVSITVGDPASSTSPLTGAISNNPVTGSVTGDKGEVPGETGAPTVLALLLLLSAGIGTFIASKRQFIIQTIRHDA